MKISVILFIAAAAGFLSISQPAKSADVIQNPAGRWESVDFVQSIDSFDPERKSMQGELFFKQVEFLANGTTNSFFTWKGNLILHNDGKTKAQFYLKLINGTTYMFLPWLNGDVIERGQKPMYYVLKKVSGPSVGSTSPENRPRSESGDEKTQVSQPRPTRPPGIINSKVAKLNIDTATIDDVIRIFGNPKEYRWDRQTFTKNNLPSQYLAIYPFGLNVCMTDGKIKELRFEKIDSGYLFADKIKIGSSLDDVLEFLGEPKETVTGGNNDFQDGILYKDINGENGFCYYGLKDRGVRFFFVNDKVSSLYVARSGFDAGSNGMEGVKPQAINQAKQESFQTVRPVGAVKEFDDVRFKDLSRLNPSTVASIVTTLWFNEKTVWPDTNVIQPGRKPDELLKKAMNPGLGVDQLHKEGITGKGVNVAIIDQPLYQDHPEFAGKIVAYFDTGCKSESSMHGPAVASLLVGTNCGTAPGAKLYYVAAPSWLKDSSYYSKAIDWIIEQNSKLPAGQKIRVVSVSAAPSGQDSPFDKNQKMWDDAYSRAEAAGILVLDCTQHHGLIGPCWINASFPEIAAKCSGGHPDNPSFSPAEGRIHAPTCPRTTAEQYNKNESSYQYCGKGGLSWAIPYVAGVLAMGWQVNPNLGPEQMKEMLFKSAANGQNGAKIIDPQKFIAMVKSTKTDDAGFTTDLMQQKH